MKVFSFLKVLFPFFTKKDRNIVLHEDFKRERPDDIPNIKQFGVKSIIRSILSVVLAVACVLGFYFCVTSGNVFFVIFGSIFCIYLFFILPIVFNVRAIILWVLQLKCNKKAIGWIALAVWLLCLVGSVAVPIILIRAM